MESAWAQKIGALIFKYRVAIQAIAVSLLSYGTALITTYVGNIKPTDDNRAVVVLGAFVVVLIMTVASTLIDKIIRLRERGQERKHDVYKTGYMTLNRERNNYIKLLRELSESTIDQRTDTPVELMNNAVSELYETLETEYGTAVSITEHVEFEVTFMTKSFKDNKITIAAWASRDGRAPKSMAKRAADPDIYAGTETAKLYADENRTVRTIERLPRGFLASKSPARGFVCGRVLRLWRPLRVHSSRSALNCAT